jgi:hypothetical protein
MTTRRAAMTTAFKPGPALVHFAYLDDERTEYYVGFSNCTRYGQRLLSVQDKAEQRRLCSPRTEQQRESVKREKETQTVVSERSDGAGLPGHGCNGTGKTSLCATLQPAYGQNVELKLLPAPQVAGLLPARVIAAPPDTYYYLTPERRHEYYKATKQGFGFQFTLEEIEVTYCDTHPERIELFKRLVMPYDLQAEYAAASQRVQDTMRNCKPKRFKRG